MIAAMLGSSTASAMTDRDPFMARLRSGQRSHRRAWLAATGHREALASKSIAAAVAQPFRSATSAFTESLG